MCEFFSALALKDGRLCFTSGDSHEDIISRLGLDDTGVVFYRNFVRLECTPPFDDVEVDEEGSLPAWFEDRRADFESRMMELAKQVNAVKEDSRLEDAWETCCAARSKAMQAYGAVLNPASKEREKEQAPYWEKRSKARNKARMAYDKKIAKIEAECAEAERPIREKFDAIKHAASAALVEACRASTDAYEETKKSLEAETWMKIPGYLPKPEIK